MTDTDLIARADAALDGDATPVAWRVHIAALRDTLAAANAREAALEAALEWYANECRYDPDGDISGHTPAERDAGKIARAALTGEPQP